MVEPSKTARGGIVRAFRGDSGPVPGSPQFVAFACNPEKVRKELCMKTITSVAAFLLISLAALAQSPPAAVPGKAALRHQSTITLAVSGLACNTPVGGGAFNILSWSWGATNTIAQQTSGAGAGKVDITGLVVTKRFDECSPALFKGVATGQVFKTVTLTQQDSNGNVVTTLTLTNATVSSWQIGGEVNNELPFESVSFNFTKVCVSDIASGTTVCYDAALDKVL